MALARIISGGQTGADRGGLDAAISLGVPHGGWCPLGRPAEAKEFRGKAEEHSSVAADGIAVLLGMDLDAHT